MQRYSNVLSKLQETCSYWGDRGDWANADHRTLEAPGKGTEGFTLQKWGFLKVPDMVQQSDLFRRQLWQQCDPSFYIRKLGTEMGPLMGLERWLSD